MLKADNNNRLAWAWIAVLAVVKLMLHLLVADQYGFHRDEYLYLAQTEHLAWGFMEVPPALAVLGFAMRAFGDGIVWIKSLPAIFGTAMMFLIAMMVRDLGGKRWAQVVAVIGFMFVPAYLRTHHLFQPVFLNQFMWTFLTFLLVRLTVTRNGNYWYGIGITIGLGMLTKYTMLFPVLGMTVGLLLTSERDWLRRKEPYLAALIALLIFIPNLYWQYIHNWPVINHMRELRETQLVNVNPGSFIGMQFLMLFTGSILWLPGLVALFGNRLLAFRAIGWMYIVVVGLLLVLSGKPYYTLGIYPVLLATGATWWESFTRKTVVRIALPSVIALGSLPLIPYGLPVFKIQKMESYCRWMKENAGLHAPLVWEDGIEHSLPQDYADMFGWEESVANLSKHYHQLPDSLRASCNFWGGSYGHAGAILYYADKYDIPRDVTSFNGSFALWAKEEADFLCELSIDDNKSLGTEYFADVVLLDSTSNPYARDPGYIIFRSEPLVDIASTWRRLISEEKAQWKRD